MYLEKRKKENKTLKYFIDLHRDSVKKNITTIEINGKKYARVMLLLGLENPNYKENEKNILKLENWLEKNYKGISRGIYRKKGKGVNGVYNQDFSDNCFLIEIGGEENTYEEVENTLDIIAQMLNDYIGDNND
jgi:stage II sporulation protein P